MLLRALLNSLLLIVTVVFSVAATPGGVRMGLSPSCSGSPAPTSRSRCSRSCSSSPRGIDDNMFLMTPGPGKVGALRHPPRDPARAGRDRRGDHLRRCSAVGHLHRAWCAPAGVPGRPRLRRRVRRSCWTLSSSGPCWSQPWPTTSARPSRWPSKLATTGRQVPKTRAGTAPPDLQPTP